MKFKRKLLPIIVALAIVCCLFGGIFGVDRAETQVARAEETISIYAETGESIAQGNTGYCYVYVDNTVDLASLTVAVHYDSQKMSVTGYYNRATCSIYDASNNDGCLKFSYIFDAEGSETKTALFYFYYKINSDAEIGNTGFDVVVEEAYTTTLEVAPYGGSRCSFDITEKKVVNTCSVYGTSTINTSVKETFEIDYRLSTRYIASGSIDVKYDPELFEFVELTQGNFLNGKVVDVNSSQRGTISLSFLATEYNYYSDLVKVKFRTLKNETATSQIQFQVNDLYNLELSPFSCSGYTTNVNVTFDSVYAEDAPSVILGASFLESTEQVLVTVLLEEGSRLGAGDFVLNFDTEDLEFVSYEKGFNPSFFNVNDKSVADGVLKFSVISMTDIVDEQTVLTILFNAKRECVNKTSNITISGTGLTDSLTNGILLNFVGTTANIPLKHSPAASVEEVTKAPTCTSKGSYDDVVYCSICEAELSRQSNVLDSLGHDLTPHDSKAPTCTEIGWNTYVTCSRCDYTTYAELPATGHTESAVVVENNVAPTCTATGSYDNVVYCATCDAELSRTTITVDALGHDIINHEGKAPTCTEIGWSAYVTCSRCEYTTYEEKSALGHDPVEHSAKAPTCTEIGWNAYVTCSRCDHTTYVEIPATGHTPESVVVENNVAPTCTATGSYDNVVYCATCDAELSRDEIVVPALGHDLIPHDSKAPTCTAIGWNTYVTCSRCDHTTYQELPATGHTESAVVVENNVAPTCIATGSYDNVVYCATCDTELSRTTITVDAIGHDLVEHSAKAPTCTEIGWNAYVTCSRCDYTTYAEIPSTGHSPESAVVENNVAPTCIATGSYDNVVYCATCDAELSRTTITVDALGHDLVEHSAKAPTCTEIGWNTYVTCSRCDHTTYAEIPATGHTESAVVVENNVAPTCTVAGSYDNVVYCATCDAELSRDEVVVPALGHDLIPHDSKAPTCTAIGWNTYVTCSRCDHTTYAEIPATGHSHNVVVTAPTCTEQGYTTHTCHCGDEYTDSYVDALGHDPVEHSAKAPTCTEIGWNTYVTCSRCDYTTYQELPATGHSHSAVVTSPTCTTQGYTTHTCYCGDSYIDSYVGALGHEEVIDKAVSPTCTATGFTEGKHCSVCEEVLVKQEVVEALGHDAIPHDSKAPTCTEIGWNTYVTCSRCDHTTYAEIPATGHTESAVVVENNVAPTCTATGSYDNVVYCAACDAELSRDEVVVPALGHDLLPHDSKAPTCTDIGWNTYVTCSRCDHTTYAEIPATGHTPESVVVENTVAPTCIVAGSYDNVVYCATCDSELSRDEVVVPALGHDLIPHDSKAPTCTAIGWNTYVTCSRCDHTTYQEITATGHKDANNDKLCDVCDASLCDVHTPSENLAFDEEGHWSVCSVCGYALEKVDHTYETATTAPTCLEQGYTTFTCHCGHSYKSNFVDALGHELVEHSAKAPTCTDIGWSAYVTCSRCDYTTYAEIPATGHTPESVVVENNDAPTCTATGSYDNVVYCATCDAELSRDEIVVPALGHDLIPHDSKAPTCTAIGWNTYVTCSRCDYTTYQELPATGHSHNAVVTAPTCTEQGYTTHTCHCGDSYIDGYVDALGHKAVLDRLVDPTCTATGLTEGSHCSVCDEVLVKQEVVEALGHDEITHNAKTPTCTEIGWNAYVTCSRCDYTTYAEIPATGHSHNAVVTAPTCTEQGYTTHTCHCGDSYIDGYVDALGHDEITHSAKTPTCTEIGWNAYVTCSRCDYTTYAEILATGHSHSTVVTAPTCTTEGYTTYTCHCGDTFVADKVAALGHDPIPHDSKAPTCTEIGWNAYVTCSRCDYTTYAEIPATGHSHNAVVTAPTCIAEGYTTYTCHCGDSYIDSYVDALGHDAIPHDSKAPTCTEIGWNVYVTCSRCDHTTYAEIPATGHTPESVVVENNDAPTCTATGSYDNVVYCATCGAELSRTTITVDALGHELVEHSAKAPTCTEIGWNAYVTCSRCDYTTYAEIPATGHTPAKAVIENMVSATCLQEGEYDSVVYCATCGEEVSRQAKTILALGHYIIHNTGKEATCTEDGWDAYDTCARCDYSTYEVVPALGHDLIPHDSKAPTCTDIGWNTYVTCSRCDHTTYAEIPATGHTPESVVVENNEAPTCTATGSYDNVVYCATCDAELSRTTITVDALGHDAIPHDSKAPTCTEIGWSAYVTCSRCDHTTYAEIPATGHSTTSHEAKEPTCTEIGWNAYVTCDKCDYTTYEELAKTPHIPSDAVKENVVESTTETEGHYDSVVYCSVCGHEISREQKTTPIISDANISDPDSGEKDLGVGEIAAIATTTSASATGGIAALVSFILKRRKIKIKK